MNISIFFCVHVEICLYLSIFFVCLSFFQTLLLNLSFSHFPTPPVGYVCACSCLCLRLPYCYFECEFLSVFVCQSTGLSFHVELVATDCLSTMWSTSYSSKRFRQQPSELRPLCESRGQVRGVLSVFPSRVCQRLFRQMTQRTTDKRRSGTTN